MNPVQAGSFLTLHYRLCGPDGDELVNTFNDKPATLSMGAGQLSPALEQRLLGLDEGTRTAFDLPAGEAFGEHNPELMQWLKLSLLRELGDPDEAYTVGDVVQFPAPDGRGRYAGTVLSAPADAVFESYHADVTGTFRPTNRLEIIPRVNLTIQRPWTDRNPDSDLFYDKTARRIRARLIGRWAPFDEPVYDVNAFVSRRDARLSAAALAFIEVADRQLTRIQEKVDAHPRRQLPG